MSELDSERASRLDSGILSVETEVRYSLDAPYATAILRRPALRILAADQVAASLCGGRWFSGSRSDRGHHDYRTEHGISQLRNCGGRRSPI
jgi:hypothetical protein